MKNPPRSGSGASDTKDTGQTMPPTIEQIAGPLQVGDEIPVTVLPGRPTSFCGDPVVPGDYLLRKEEGDAIWLARADPPRVICGSGTADDPVALTVSNGPTLGEMSPMFGPEVDHPAHYGGADNPYEAIKVIEAWEVGFNLGTVLKYLARAGKKAGEPDVKDLKKCLWYLQREIELRERRHGSGTS